MMGVKYIPFLIFIFASILFFLDDDERKWKERKTGDSVITATVVMYGLSRDWASGAPFATNAQTEYVIMPLLAYQTYFDVFICTDKAAINESIFEETILRWEPIKVTLFMYEDSKLGRRQHCFERIMSAKADSPSPDFWVTMRTDFIPLSPLPKLSTLPQNEVSARARMAHLYENLTTNQFSWLFDNDLCVDDCSQPCPRFKRQYFMADDQIQIVPKSLSPIFFNIFGFTNEEREIMANSPACSDLTDESTSIKYWPEHFEFTCPLMFAGVSFSPLEIAGRLNPHSRKTRDGWVPLQEPITPPITKICT